MNWLYSRPNAKRRYKNQKFGFGGKKKGSKWNTRESYDDVSSFRAKTAHGKGLKRPGKKGSNVSEPGGQVRGQISLLSHPPLPAPFLSLCILTLWQKARQLCDHMWYFFFCRRDLENEQERKWRAEHAKQHLCIKNQEKGMKGWDFIMQLDPFCWFIFARNFSIN